MDEVAVNVMHFTMKNELEAIMNPWVANILRRTNAVAIAQAKSGYLATVIFPNFGDMAEAIKHLRKIKIDVECDRKPAFVNPEIFKSNEFKSQEKKEAEERFLYEFIEKTEKEKAEILRHVKELEDECERLKKLASEVKRESEKVVRARDERIKELTKELIGVEHRLKEMEELRMRTLSW